MISKHFPENDGWSALVILISDAIMLWHEIYFSKVLKHSLVLQIENKVKEGNLYSRG